MNTWCAIVIQNTTHGEIIENTVYKGHSGIVLLDCENTLVQGNEVYNNHGSGMEIYADCVNYVIKDNLFYDNGEYGIYCRMFSSENNITDNVIHGNNLNGLYLYMSSDNYISGNEIYINSVNGIILRSSKRNILFNNSIHDNTSEGILTASSSWDNEFLNNTIYSHNSHGICLDSDNNSIKWNNFTDNNPGGNSQARDEGDDNVFEGNYWSDWDGSSTYEIDKHTITVPIINNPVAGTTVSGVIEVTWTVAIDSLGCAVTYTVYYSDNNGSSWSLLIEDLETTNYTWNTAVLDDGGDYLIKVKANAVAPVTGSLSVEGLVDGVFTINNTVITTTTTTVTVTATTGNTDAAQTSGWLVPTILAVFLTIVASRKRKNRK